MARTCSVRGPDMSRWVDQDSASRDEDSDAVDRMTMKGHKDRYDDDGDSDEDNASNVRTVAKAAKPVSPVVRTPTSPTGVGTNKAPKLSELEVPPDSMAFAGLEAQKSAATGWGRRHHKKKDATLMACCRGCVIH